MTGMRSPSPAGLVWSTLALLMLLALVHRTIARGPVSHSEPIRWIDGTIIGIDDHVKTIRVRVGEGKKARTVVVSAAGAERPTIEIDGKPAVFSALRTGMSARVKARGNVAMEIVARSAAATAATTTAAAHDTGPAATSRSTRTD
jgi:hypothetical protein